MLSSRQVTEHADALYLQYCKQVPGFDYLALSEPSPLKKYHRVGWVQFKSIEDMPQAIEVLCESKEIGRAHV